ncbi:hypothetical protein FOZ63_033235, partial [Perkinsus olseni]
MDLFAPEKGGKERAERVVEEIHRVVSSAGSHLVDGFIDVVHTVASIQPKGPPKGSAADSSPPPADPSKQRAAQNTLDQWRRAVRLVQTSVSTLSFIASAVVENGRSSSDNAPMSESGMSSSSLPTPFMFSGRAEAYTTVLAAAMSTLAELCGCLSKALDEALVVRVRGEMPVEMLSDLASLWSLHANALEGCREIVAVENAVDETGVSSLSHHCSSTLDTALPLFSKLDWGRERSYGSAIGELLQALYQSLVLASTRGCCSLGDESEGLVARSVQMTALRPPLSEDMVQAQVACIGWLGRCHGDAVDVCEGLLQLVKLHAGEKGAFSRQVLVAAFEAIFEVFGADDNPAADS